MRAGPQNLPHEGKSQIPCATATCNLNSQLLAPKANFEPVQPTELFLVDSFAIEQDRMANGINTLQRNAHSEVCALLQLPMRLRRIHIPAFQLHRNCEEFSRLSRAEIGLSHNDFPQCYELEMQGLRPPLCAVQALHPCIPGIPRVGATG